MKIPTEVIELVKHFQSNAPAFRSGTYNETQVRREFIDPFFESLGWDVRNQQKVSEIYKEVIHEDAIKVGGSTKAPDYCFRLGGTRKFFVEAKKPLINLDNSIDAAFQIRRYGWSAKLPISILTDFEELALYDCRVMPVITDRPTTARIRYIKYSEYADRWDEIYTLFSKEAVQGGSLEEFAESKPQKGTTTVDTAFLKEIESWREQLAVNLSLRNPELNQRELNFAVQMTVNRLIFLRICEDRGIEPYGQLLNLQKGKHVYEQLCQLFHRADDRYNSGLFHFRKESGRVDVDEFTLNVKIDDKPLQEIIQNLYYPDSPYEFSVIPIEILGQVYEQFLGKVISLSSNHKVVIEDKPEVRKAGGVFYTPTYIVDYIVKNTVGKLLEGKTPKQASELKICDPACGSGSFLIRAYQFLLHWHLEQYATNPQKYKKQIYKCVNGDWKLNSAEKKRILLNNIYGVDIDTQAVETTKLSLLLEVLGGETQETVSRQLKLFQDRALPDLENNIKYGNSLISSDFYDNKQLNLIDEEERYQVNAFDWETGFSSIIKSGGFDVVIGNPPYTYMISALQQNYFSSKYQHQDYQKDLYLLFLERYEHFLKPNGLLGIIVSNTWLQSVTLKKIRRYLTTHYLFLKILHLPERVFRAIVDTHILIFQKVGLKTIEPEFFQVEILRRGKVSLWHTLPYEKIPKNGGVINITAPVEAQNLFLRIKSKSLLLEEICKVFNGVKPFEKGKGNPPQTEQVMKEKPYVHIGVAPDSSWSPLLRGSLIQRYKNLWKQDSWILYGAWLAAPRNPAIFEEPLKIMVRQTGDSIIATIVEGGFIGRDNLHIILPKDFNYNLRYVLGIINSKLINFAYRVINPEKGEALAQVKKYHLEQLPIRPINFSNLTDKTKHDRMVALVEQMLSLHQQLETSRASQDKTLIQRQLEATDRQIDKLVYELYELTEEEIAIVEGAV